MPAQGSLLGLAAQGLLLGLPAQGLLLGLPADEVAGAALADGLHALAGVLGAGQAELLGGFALGDLDRKSVV